MKPTVEERGERERRGRRNNLGLMPKVMNDGLPGLVEFVSIITVKIVWMFFNFQSFTNDVRWVIGC
jgi:hypothetical protein